MSDSISIPDLSRELLGLWQDVLKRRPPDYLRANLGKGCWIYGAGGYGQRVRRLLREAGIPFQGFIDLRGNDPAFAVQLAEPVIPPDRFSEAEARGHTLVIGIMNPFDSFAAPSRWAAGFPFADVVQPGELPEVLGSAASNYWMADRRHAASHIADIAELAGSLADEASVATVAALARFRISADPDMQPVSDMKHQYCPPDLAFSKEPMVFVDGGAYTGDSYETLTRQGIQIAEWYAFEPDLQNFKRLSAFARGTASKVALFPCGLSDVSSEIHFAEGGGAGSHAAAGAASIARVLALDETLVGVTPTFIKLDIEGFEAQALDGMSSILSRNSPRLAICIYHKPEDLWELPKKIRTLLPGARLYVRQHGFNGFDTVLYALPDKWPPRGGQGMLPG